MTDPSQPEAQGPVQASPSAKPKKPALPPSRIALLIFVLAAAVVIVLEVHARWQCTGSYKAIEDALAKDEEQGKGLYRKDLDELLCGSPSREMVGGTETFTWRGILRSYRMKIDYGVGEFVLNVEQVP